jgi:hypothetical protein
MTKISNQYSLTNVLTADVVNGRVGINNGSPTVALDVTGAGKFSNVVTATRGSFAPSFIAIGSSAGNGQIQISNSANYVIGAGTDYGGMSFTVGGGERLNILNNGSVGIGTSSPPHNLSVKGSSATDMISWTDNVNNTGYLGIRGGGVVWMNADNNLVFATAASERMRITSGGDVFINSTSTINSEKLFVRQSSSSNLTGIAVGYGTSANQFRSMSINSSNIMTFNNGSNEATLTAAGAWANASDARLKKNIIDIKYGLDIILKSQPRSYNRIDIDGEYIGFIAQELIKLIPEVVSGDLNSQYCVDYGSLVAIAFKAIQELSADLTSAKQEIELLKAK